MTCARAAEGLQNETQCGTAPQQRQKTPDLLAYRVCMLGSASEVRWHRKILLSVKAARAHRRSDWALRSLREQTRELQRGWTDEIDRQRPTLVAA